MTCLDDDRDEKKYYIFINLFICDTVINSVNCKSYNLKEFGWKMSR
jgi:hypothetical protein